MCPLFFTLLIYCVWIWNEKLNINFYKIFNFAFMWLGNFPGRNELKSRIITQKTWVSHEILLTGSVFWVTILDFNPFLAGKWPCHIKAKVKSFRNWCLIFFFRLKFPLLGAFVWTQKSFRNIKTFRITKNPVLMISKKEMYALWITSAKEESNLAKFLIKLRLSKPYSLVLLLRSSLLCKVQFFLRRPQKFVKISHFDFKFIKKASIQLEDFVKYLWLL